MILDDVADRFLWLLSEGQHRDVGVGGEVLDGQRWVFGRAAHAFEALWQGTRGGGQEVDGPDGEQRDGGEGEEPAQRGGPAWSDHAFPKAQRRPTHQRKQKGSSAHSRGQVFPAQLEDRQGAVPGHIPDVVTEAFGSVDPADGYRLEDGEEQQAGSTAGEMVIYLEHIQTTWRDHDQSN